MIKLTDRKIYIYIVIQNLEHLIKTSEDLSLKGKYKQELQVVREDEKLVDHQIFVQDSMARNEQMTLENIEGKSNSTA